MEMSLEQEKRSELYQEFLASEREVRRMFFQPLTLRKEKVIQDENKNKRIALDLLNLPPNYPKDDPIAMRRIIEANKFLLSLTGKLFSTIDTDFARNFLSSGNSEVLDKLEKHFWGKVVVDLGCGTNDRVMKIFEYSARGYIGVDLGVGELRSSVARQEVEAGYPVSLISDDMLHFVSSLPDDSANFFMVGIDHIILQNGRYRKRLGQEIYRATEKGGVFFVNSSDIDILRAVETAGLVSDRPIESELNAYFFRKEK